MAKRTHNRTPAPATVGDALNAQLATGAPAPIVLAGPAAATTAAKPKKIRALRVPMQANLRDALNAAATAEKTTPAQIVRNLLATTYEITLEATKAGGATKKYDSPEERKAASKTRRATKAALLALLVAKNAGDLDALMAEAAKTVAAKNAPAPAPTPDVAPVAEEVPAAA